MSDTFTASGITIKVDDFVESYPVEDLERAFDLVAGGHWKDPIDAEISPEAYDLTAEAVRFYTATDLEIVGKTPEGLLRVVAIGYRNGPAGP